ncbi:unnamed protein product [Amoebophrya sp. A120]|nr:unnamed protein product [Amoebophrya sp. A120]|eukprot:GSA120T00011732001.1
MMSLSSHNPAARHETTSVLGATASSAADLLSHPQKQTLRDVEREIDAKLREIAELESELLLSAEEELAQEQLQASTKGTTQDGKVDDDAASLVSVGPQRPAPAIKRLRKRPEDAKWRYLQQRPDPTDRCRELLLSTVLPKPPEDPPRFPKMPHCAVDEPPVLSHDPLLWRMQRCFEGP